MTSVTLLLLAQYAHYGDSRFLYCTVNYLLSLTHASPITIKIKL